MQVLTSTVTPTPLDAQDERLCQQPQDLIDFYEAQIVADETIVDSYWQLGLTYLLAGREEDAQATWFIPLADGSEGEIASLTADLSEFLERAALDLTQISDLDRAWLLRQYIWMLAPDRLENILHSIGLANLMGTLTNDLLVEWQIPELLQNVSIGTIDEDLLESVLEALVNIWTDLSLEIITYCLKIGCGRQLIIGKLLYTLQSMFDRPGCGAFIVKLVETCNEIEPNILSTLQLLSQIYVAIGRYAEAIAIAEQYYQLATGIIDRLFGSYLIQRTHFITGNWQGVEARVDVYRQLLSELVETSHHNLNRQQCQSLLISSFFLPYIGDNPRIDKSLRNQIATIYQQNIQSISVDPNVKDSLLAKKTGCLRIGYIASTLRKHSVGWLTRWLIHHHDRQSFQVFLYCLNIREEDSFNHQWFRDKVDITSYFGVETEEVVAQIRADEIDILIDLDSLTFDMTCLTMAEKPAPVQVSWLGWDSTGIPAIDYFIADPYVLPDDAQDYYSEKIWRLPQTYLAVDGFEVGIPTLKRKDLGIATDAVVYLSGQSGYKRHPDCIKAQMQIIKAVPNSYFLIKGESDPKGVQNFFGKLAAEVGIGIDRLRFLPRDRDEITHRANLAIADIVLDTFPYNGATTTLETLWMGIPIVTKVGQQFAARNSYTFMLNAGIEEGIAWSQEEYIEWGIKLGLDRELRDKIAGKLRSGRATTPVWNAKQFTLDMEQAYRQMWATYQEQSKHQEIDKYLKN